MIEMDMPKLEVLENDDFYAKVVCEPLEKGFGLTIGNCLRRILLSALPGAAVEGIKFLDGSVKHELSAVAGIKEDVTEIILNLKTLAIKTKVIDKEYEKVLHICKEGPAVLTGKDLNIDAEIEVINGDQYICMIDEGSMFVTGPSSAPLTASALRSSGQVQTIALDHMICLMVIENACVGTSSLEANHPSPTCCIRHLSSSGTTW